MSKAFVKFELKEAEFIPHPKLKEDIDSFLRCNPKFDGYVFLPKINNKAKTGAYILEKELGNQTLIPRPSEVLYYQKKTNAFYTLTQINK